MKFNINYLTLLFILIKAMTNSPTSWWWIVPLFLIDFAVIYFRLARWAMDKDIKKLKGE